MSESVCRPSQCHDASMSTPDVRPTREQRTLILSGFVIAVCGLGLLAGADNWGERFLSSVLTYVGSIILVPQLIAVAVKRYG